MQDYDGFSTVHDPHEYMNAPSMIIPEGNLGSAFQPGPTAGVPMIVQAAVDYTQNFVVLSADELQSFYAEKNSLQRQLSDVNERLLVETKMHEAAQSLSKLHSDGASVHSIPTNHPKIAGSKRLSRLLGGQDPHAKGEKRLSRQAEEEVTISAGKISDLEKMQLQVELRHMQVENIIVQHHAGVLAKEVTGQTFPNHRRNRSTASTVSLSAPMSPPQPNGRMSMINAAGAQTPKSSANVQRQSWMMPSPSKQPGNHRRQLSNNGDVPYLGPSNEQTRVSRSPQQQQQSQQTLVNSRRTVDAEDLDKIGLRISELDPHQGVTYDVNSAPQEKLSYISHRFEALSRDLNQLQVKNSKSENSIKDLEEDLKQVRHELEATKHEHGISKQTSRGVSPPSESVSSAGAGSSAVARGFDSQSKDTPQASKERELLHRIEVEHSTSLKWRNQFEQQRRQLLETTQSLEEVTNMAVSYEGEKSNFHQLIAELESKIDSLEIDKSGLLKQRLGTTANTSLLCQEFQRIVDDLVTKHEAEIRALYPKFKPPHSSNLNQKPTKNETKLRSNANEDTMQIPKRNKNLNTETDDTQQTGNADQKLSERSIGSSSATTTRKKSESSIEQHTAKSWGPNKPLPNKPGDGSHSKSEPSASSGSKHLNRPNRKPIQTQNNVPPSHSPESSDDPVLPSPLNDGKYSDLDDDIEETPTQRGHHRKQISQSTIKEQPRSSLQSETHPSSETRGISSYNASNFEGPVSRNDEYSEEAFASTLNDKNYTDNSLASDMDKSYNSADMSGNSDENVDYHHQPPLHHPYDDEDSYNLSKDNLELPRTSEYYNDSMENSIQHTSESLMRPEIDRKNTEASEYSKASSFYGDSSANASRSSFMSRNQGDLPKPQMSNISLPTRGNIREQSFDFDDDDELL